MTSLLVLLLAVLVVLLVALLFLLYRTRGPPISSAKDQKDMKSSSTSSSLSPESGYDVFLSFTGNDTPTNFVDDLSCALMGKGFCVFMAEEPSKDDKTIPKELLEVIEESKFAIVILSRKYVSSTRCLDELVKIIECREHRKKAVLPLFYQVDISKVRRQTGQFEGVFAKHESRFKRQHNRVQKWRQALKVLTEISGIDLKQSMDSEVIPEIVTWISKELKYDFLTTKIKLVDADSRVNKVKSYLDLESNDSRVVGIWGMAGIGNTTIAKQVFADIRDQFEVYSFVPNIREQLAKHTVVHLQKILIRSLLDSDADIETDYEGISILRYRLRFKKVLIVLDDVASIEQLESLVGKSGDRGYFGPKSRIIITTRDKHVLSISAVKNRSLQVDKLNLKESLQLLCLKAFRQNHPPGNFNDLCDEVVGYADGLPLALEVLGSFLYGRPREVWLDALSVLRKEPMKEIFVPLRISYDGLTALEKTIFLDIACFFVGEDENRVSKILHACGFEPSIGISVLVEKSLITVEKNALLMHGLVRQMGWEIVRQESPQEPNKRTRLGQHEDIYDILKEKKEAKAVEGIILRKPENQKIDLNADAFSNMSSLRLLKIYNVDISDPPSLPDNLRLLEWQGYPLNKLTLPNKLVELRLCNSRSEVLLTSSLPLEILVVIDLSNCKYLTKTPDFKMFPYLEMLIFEGCISLLEVDPSIMHLQKLSQLNFKDCKNLLSLSNELWSMTTLRTLDLSGCSNLPPLPKHNLKHLKIILPSSNKVAKVDDFRKSVEEQCMKHKPQASNECIRQDMISENMGSLYQCNDEEEATSQEKLPTKSYPSLSLFFNFKSLPQLPRNITIFSQLQRNIPKFITILNLIGTPIVTVPESIEVLSILKSFKLEDCKRLETLPGNIYNLKRLEVLHLNCCTKLKTFPEIYEAMESLRELVISESAIQELPSHVEYLIGLTKLSLNGCKNLVSLPINIRHLGNLALFLCNCESLKSLAEPMSNPFVCVENCTSLETVTRSTIALTSNKGKEHGYLEYFELLNCPKLNQNAYNNIMADTLLRIYRESASTSIPHLQGVDRTFTISSGLYVVYPGNQFPEWIEGEKAGDLLYIRKLCPGRSFSKVLGLVICAHVGLTYHECYGSYLEFHASIGGSKIRHSDSFFGLHGSIKYDSVVGSNRGHVIIRSFPFERWLSSFDVNTKQVDFELLGRFVNEYGLREKYRVRKWGFKGIYAEELEEFKANNQNEGDQVSE